MKKQTSKAVTKILAHVKRAKKSGSKNFRMQSRVDGDTIVLELFHVGKKRPLLHDTFKIPGAEAAFVYAVTDLIHKYNEPKR